ncbi:MAG: hypothetical protein PHS37_03050 [Candidatus Omnitrophica bacterium]|nr:hypothetical protein [Candidatus Omnitrophota bacterium]
MAYLSVIIQLALGLVCLTVPGIAVLRYGAREESKRLPPALFLSLAFLISSLIIACFQFILVSLAPPFIARLATMGFVIAVLIVASGYGRVEVRDLWSRMPRGERYAAGVVLALIFLWSVLMPLSPYPSQISLELGDPPSYYCIARNLADGKGWMPGFLVGDYAAGMPEYIKTFPIPTLITVFSFRITGFNVYALSVYNMIAGGLMLYLFATLAGARTGRAVNDKIIFLLTLTGAIIPAYFLLFGLGVVTSAVALAFLVIVSLLIMYPDQERRKAAYLIVALIFMFCYRPEAAYLAAVTFISYAFFKAVKTRLSGVIASIGLLIAAGVGWSALPRLLGVLVGMWNGMSIGFLYFNPARKCFSLTTGNHWASVNKELSSFFFSDNGTVRDIINWKIGSEIQGHPFIFIKFLFDRFLESAYYFVESIIQPLETFVKFTDITAVIILAVMLAAGLIKSRKLPAFVIIAYLMFLPLANMGYGVRHILAVSPVIVALFLRSIIRLAGERLPVLAEIAKKVRIGAVFIGVGLFVFVFDVLTLYEVRTSPSDRTYVRLLEDVKAISADNDLIASSYPQLITCMTGRMSVGTTWLFSELPNVIRKYHPDIVVLDNARDGPANYTLFRYWIDSGRPGFEGYIPIVHNPDECYIILRSRG